MACKKLILVTILTATLIAETKQSRRIRDVSSSHTNGKISDFAMKALGTFQRFMKEGNSELGIPVLDPVQMQSFNYSLVNAPVGFRMEILFESPALTGLSNYELNSVNEIRNPEGSKLQLTIVFPSVQIKGSYSANGNLFSFFPMSGSGDFNIVGSSQVLSAEATLKMNTANDTLIVDRITSQFVGGRVKSQFSDPSSTGPFAGLLSEFLSAMGTQVFDKKLKPVITVAMNDYTKEWLNGAFSSVNLSEILGIASSRVSESSLSGQSSSAQSFPTQLRLDEPQPQQVQYIQPQTQSAQSSFLPRSLTPSISNSDYATASSSILNPAPWYAAGIST